MLRQEKRAESQALLQTAANVSQIVPLNMKAFVEHFLDSYGIQDKERYFAHPPGTVGAAGRRAAAAGRAGRDVDSAGAVTRTDGTVGPGQRGGHDGAAAARALDDPGDVSRRPR